MVGLLINVFVSYDRLKGLIVFCFVLILNRKSFTSCLSQAGGAEIVKTFIGVRSISNLI